MGHHHIPLDEERQNLCTMVLPRRKHCYKRLPMGVSSAPDVFQQMMVDLLGDLEFAQVCMDDVLITSNSSMEHHLHELQQILARLEDIGFRADSTKCQLFQTSLDCLGCRMTRSGVTAQAKRVQAIHDIQPPVNCYRDSWQQRSHIFASLNSPSSPKTPWKWTDECQAAFNKMKRVVSHETLLTFPDFNEEFHIHADASDCELGAVIMQKGKPPPLHSTAEHSM